MILAVDVHYSGNSGVAAGVSFHNWAAAAPLNTYISKILTVPAYESGKFYKRELPCILALLTEHNLNPTTIVVDGFVFLDGHSQAGLGKYLYDALGQRTIVYGVAKTAFKGIPASFGMTRGQSKTPLFITAVGATVNQAKQHIHTMHGPYRMPTILKLVDHLCRQNS